MIRRKNQLASQHASLSGGVLHGRGFDDARVIARPEMLLPTMRAVETAASILGRRSNTSASVSIPVEIGLAVVGQVTVTVPIRASHSRRSFSRKPKLASVRYRTKPVKRSGDPLRVERGDGALDMMEREVDSADGSWATELHSPTSPS
jgi:hypothetical protein